MESSQQFSIQWMPVGNHLRVTNEEVITMQAHTEEVNVNNFIDMSTLPTNLHQIAAENLIYMAQDGHIDTICDDLIEEDLDGTTEDSSPNEIAEKFRNNNIYNVGSKNNNDSKSNNGNNHDCNSNSSSMFKNENKNQNNVEHIQNDVIDDQSQYFECQVTTEEIITDDWVQQQGEERVEVSVDQITSADIPGSEDIDVPLPTDQDEYTALRPYPCDFCSKRFKKKLSLMNHMIAHKNDRPHICNFCGCRYMRRTDLLNHLKIHASIGEHHIDEFDENYIHLNDHTVESQSNIGRSGDHYYDQVWDEVEAITAEYDNRKHNSKIKQNKNSTPMMQTKYKDGGKIKKNMEYIKTENSIQSDELTRYPILDERKPFVCQTCGIAFTREKAYLSHKRTHTNNSPSFECTNCSEMFYDVDALNDHQRIHSFEESHSEYEPGQGEDSESNDSSKFGEFYCNICGMSFHRQDLLRRHSKVHIKKEVTDNNYIGQDPRHCCNVCGENFEEALDLLAHAEIHARSQPFKCVLCGETFLEEATIKKHVSNVHLKELTTYSCVLCGKSCKDRKSLIKHSWEHSKEKNHFCTKCGKGFHNKARLNRHMVSHRNKTVICEVCHEDFPDGRSLMNHRHSHSNTSGKLFPCNECGKSFGSRSSQQIHIRIHTGERPYGCRFCRKAFADGGTLRKHERIHTGEKPYVCSVCPRAFNQRVVLREHIRSHHSAVDMKRGTYFCSICSSDLPDSMELIQHLIQHSDMHTAMKRQPITGPRKYKRRRKLKPHELERLRTEQQARDLSDIDYSDIDMEDVDELLGMLSKSKKSNRFSTTASPNKRERTKSNSSTNRIRKYSNNSDKLNSNNWQSKLITSSTNEDYNSVMSNLENTLENIDTLVVSNTSVSTPIQNSRNSLNNNENSYNNRSEQCTPNECGKTTENNSSYNLQSTKIKVANNAKNKKNNCGQFNNNNLIDYNKKRPKMIHTEKTRVSNEEGKRKTRTLITTEPVSINHNENNFQKSKQISSDEIDTISPDIHRKIKQENSSNQPHRQNLLLPSPSDLYDAQLLLEAVSARKDFDKYIPNVANDLDEILRSPDKNISPNRSLNDDIELDIKNKNNLSSYSSSSNKTNSVYDDTDELKFIRRRSSRLRRILPNRKYLGYETSSSSSVTLPKLQKNSIIKQNKSTKKQLKQKPESPIIIKDEISHAVDTVHDNINIKYENIDINEIDKEKFNYNCVNNSDSNSNDSNSIDNNNNNNNNNNDDDDDDADVSDSNTISIKMSKKETKLNCNNLNNSKFKCEMCSASFSDRAQLLVHVPIHI